MTKKLTLIALFLISLLTACKDDEPAPYKCADCVDQPEASAANDNTGKGIYKGVLVGSSGTVKFDIANNGETIKAVLVIDGTSVTLTPNGSYESSSGFQGAFTGILNGGGVIIPFTASNTGVVVVGTPIISGHSNVVIKVFKEKSTQLVEAFEGTYKGGTGTFNLVLIRNSAGVGEWIAIAKSDTNSIFVGQVEGDAVFGGGGEIDIEGEISGDNIEGVWEETSTGASGSWTGKRTL